jgi:steroid delta-isomerase-like uncharacterized protein
VSQSPKQVVETMIGAMNRGDLDTAMALIAPDAVDHAPVPGQAPGVEGWRAKWEMMGTAFPDVHFAIEESIEVGDTVATRYSMRGTHTGDFMGMPPTGRTFEALTLDMIHVRDGKVVEHWGLIDQMAMMAQLGLLPAPDPTP